MNQRQISTLTMAQRHQSKEKGEIKWTTMRTESTAKLLQSPASVAKPSEPSQSQHSVQTNEIDQLLKIEIMEKSYLKPHNSEVSNSNKRVLKVTESEFVEIEEEEEKKEENAEETKKQQRSQVALEDKEEKVKEVNVLLKERIPSSISQQESSQKNAHKSKLKEQKVKRLEKEEFVKKTIQGQQKYDQEKQRHDFQRLFQGRRDFCPKKDFHFSFASLQSQKRFWWQAQKDTKKSKGKQSYFPQAKLFSYLFQS